MNALHRIFALSSLFAVAAASQAQIVNGGFELPAIANGIYVDYTGGSTAITGWTVVGTDVDLVNTNYTEPGTSGGTARFLPHSGNQSLDLTGVGNTGSSNGVTQSVTTLAGLTYNVSFYVGRTDVSPTSTNYATPSTVDLSIGGGSRVSYTNSDVTVNSTNWKPFTASFVATGATTSIAFLNGTPAISSGGNAFAGLDDVSVQAAPEPSALAALGLGLGAMAFAKQRKRA